MLLVASECASKVLLDLKSCTETEVVGRRDGVKIEAALDGRYGPESSEGADAAALQALVARLGLSETSPRSASFDAKVRRRWRRRRQQTHAAADTRSTKTTVPAPTLTHRVSTTGGVRLIEDAAEVGAIGAEAWAGLDPLKLMLCRNQRDGLERARTCSVGLCTRAEDGEMIG